MTYILKPGSKIRFEGYLSDDYTTVDTKTIVAYYEGDVKEMGPAQDGDKYENCSVPGVEDKDTLAAFAVKVKTQVDAKIAEG